MRCQLARDDVIQMAYRESLDINATAPGIAEALNAVGRENQIEIKGAVFQLDEVFATLNVGSPSTVFLQRILENGGTALWTGVGGIALFNAAFASAARR